jgi:hypothetical protein
MLALAACGVSSSGLTVSQHLVTHYEPSQATGWPAPFSSTTGGYQSSMQASYGHKTYHISLLPFGQAGSSPNPVYEAVPKDPDVAFEKTLAREYGRYYAFRYLGGLPGGAKFVVECYSVLVYGSAELGWRAELYFIYKPGKTGPAINSDLQFIQVFYQSGDPRGSESFVDTMHGPFYGEAGGLTSINGHQIVNFFDQTRQGSATPQPQVVRVETFLAKDTGRRNAAGKKIVNIYGGIEWGYSLKPGTSGDA